MRWPQGNNRYAGGDSLLSSLQPRSSANSGLAHLPKSANSQTSYIGQANKSLKASVTQLQNRANVTSCVRMECNDTYGTQHSAGHRGRAPPKLESITVGVVLVLPLEEKGLLSSFFF